MRRAVPSPSLPALLTALALAATPTLVAQRTWIVDAARGPGTHFADLPPALAAAGDGDTILVRPGRYLAGDVSAGIHLLGEGTPELLMARGPLRVAAVGRGRQVTIANFRLLAGGLTTAVELIGNAGTIHLQALVSDGAGGIHAERCHAVTLNECSITQSAPALRCIAAHVAVGGSVLAGLPAESRTYFSTPSTPAVVAEQSRVVLSFTRVSGGDGDDGYGGFVPASPALRLRECRTSIGGDAGTLCAAGTAPRAVPTVAIATEFGELRVDPTVTLRPDGGAPAIGGAPQWWRLAPVPALRASGAAPGGVLDVTLHATAGHVALSVLGLPSPPIATPLGDFWVAPQLAFPFDLGAVAGNGLRTARLTLPALPVLRGRGLAVQSLLCGAGAYELSNPLGVVLR